MKGLFGKLMILFVVPSLFAGSALYAVEAPEVEWFYGYGTDDEDMVHYVIQTSDGGYLMAGQASVGKTTDMLIVKTDGSGTEQWQQIIGTVRQHDWATYCAEVSDGYIVSGAIVINRDQERALVKLNKSTGEVIWQRTYPASGNDSIRGIDITSDGGIVGTGYTGSGSKGYSFITDDGAGFILKTDSGGILQWEKTLTGTKHGMRVNETATGFAIAGNVWVVDGVDHQDVALVLTDSSGNETATYNYGHVPGNETCYDFQTTSDGGYIFAGHTYESYGVPAIDFLLLKVGSDEVEEWHKTFGQPRGYDPAYIFDEGYGVEQTPDGGYVMVGGSGDEDDTYSDCTGPIACSDLYVVYVVKTDSTGTLEWESAYGSPDGHNAGEDICLTSDGYYAISVDSDTAPSGSEPPNFGLMKLGEPAEPCTATDMHIESVVCSEVSCGGPNRNGRATVTIYDDCGDPVTDALVDGTFSGDFNETFYDVPTDTNGEAVFTTEGCMKKPSFSFTVDDVTDTLPHDPADDLATGCSG